MNRGRLRSRDVFRSRRPELERLEGRRLLSAIVEFPIRAVGNTANQIATGPDGKVWVTSSTTLQGVTTDNIQVIDPNSLAVVHTYPIPTLNSGPGAIALGPDKNYWFVETAANRIATVNAVTGAIQEFPLLATPNAGLQSITAGPDGKLWFTETNANQIGSIDPKTHVITEYPVPTNFAEPYGIASDPKDGTVWFSEAGSNRLGFINTATHAINELPIPQSTGNDQAEALAYDPIDGNVWFLETGANQIGMVNAATHLFGTPVTKLTANAQLAGITVTTTGDVWFTESKATLVGVVRQAGHAVSEFLAPGSPQGIVQTADGTLWATTANNGTILPMYSTAGTPLTSAQLHGQPVAPPTAIIPDASGKLWFSEPQPNGIPLSGVGVFDPSTHLDTLITAPFVVSAFAANPDGTLWFTDTGSNEIGKINPTTDTVSKVATVPTPNANMNGIVYDPKDGLFWFTEYNTSKLGNINPTNGGSINDNIPLPAGADPYGITVDGNGRLWFAEFGTNQVGEYDPTTGKLTQFSLSSVSPVGITTDGGGYIWFTEAGENGGPPP